MIVEVCSEGVVKARWTMRHAYPTTIDDWTPIVDFLAATARCKSARLAGRSSRMLFEARQQDCCFRLGSKQQPGS
jgi:hypothetical protein